MTDAPAQQHLRLPVDESAPPERLRWPLLLAVGAAAVLIHLALITVFIPLAPDAGGSAAGASHSTAFISSQFMQEEPFFLKMVDTYDPVSFLHPPEEVGFSFFRSNRDDFALDAQSEPVLPPQSPAELDPLPPFELEAVVRPLARDVAGTDDDSETTDAPVVSYPYCVADSRPDVSFPAIPLDMQTERILRRTLPSRPSVFEIRHTPEIVVSSGGDPGIGTPDPRCEAILKESCGVAELDLAARSWLDTLLNSQDAPESFSRGDRCRVVWSAKALGKEPSLR